MKSFRVILIISSIFFVLFASLCGFEFYKNTQLKKELNAKEERMAEAKEAKTKTEKIQAEISKLHSQIVSIEEKIPQDQDVSLELVRKMTMLGEESGLKKIEFVYLEKVASSFSKNLRFGKQKPADEDGISSASMETKPLRLKMSFECEFPKLITFLRRVMELERLILIEGLSVQRSGDSIPRQSVSLDLVTYTFISK